MRFYTALTILLMLSTASWALERPYCTSLVLKQLVSATNFAKKNTKIQGLARIHKGVKRLDEGSYIYLMLEDGSIYSAPRLTKKGVQGHLQLLAALKTKSRGRVRIIGAGELEVGKNGLIQGINNRSGTFRPGKEHLDAASSRLKSFGLTARSIRLGDYSKISKKHPLYIENSILDVSHTIVAVEAIGREEFLAALKSKKPLETIRERMSANVSNKASPPSGTFIPPSKLTKSELKEFIDESGWTLDKEDYAGLSRPFSFSKFEKAFSTFRNDSSVFLDEDEFLDFFLKNVREHDEFTSKYTQLTITTQVRLGEEARGVELYFVSMLKNSVLKSNDDYHNNTLDYWTDLLEAEQGYRGLLDHTRGGILAHKTKGSKTIKFWLLPQYEFRHGHIDVRKEKADFELKIP